MTGTDKFQGFTVTSLSDSHKEKNLPCQDSVAHLEGQGLAVAAVAEGQGGLPYFRSDVGSRLAVEVAMEKLSDALATHWDAYCGREDWEKNQKQLIGSILYQWRMRIWHLQTSGCLWRFHPIVRPAREGAVPAKTILYPICRGVVAHFPCCLPWLAGGYYITIIV
jgi:hypothetical protein